MRNLALLMISVLMLFLTALSANCASSQLVGVPPLANRTLELAPDFPGFFYQYKVCTKRVFFICVETRMQKDTYDITDAAIRKQLLAAGFVAKVREKP